MRSTVVLAAAGMVMAFGAGQARADTVLPSFTEGYAAYYVETCSDYLAHPAEERPEVLLWMSQYQVHGGTRSKVNRAQKTDSFYSGGAADLIANECADKPDMQFGSLLERHHFTR